MNRLQKLIELRAARLSEIDATKEARQAILDAVEAEAREDLTADEDAEFRAKTASIKDAQAVVDDLSGQIADLEAEEARAGKDNEIVQRAGKARVEVLSEAPTYERGNGRSYFQDMARRTMGMADDDALDRLRRHSLEARALDRVDGTGGFKCVATAAA